MSNEPAPEADEDDEVAEGRTKAAKPAGKKKKLIVIAAAAVLVLGGGGTAGMMLLGGGGDKAEAGHEEKAEKGSKEGEGKDSFVDVPPMMVNLRTPDGAAHFLKLHFMLVAGPKSTAEGLKEKLPILLDAFQPFLRELRPEDLAGSAAVFRIKEEMLARAREALGDGAVADILIQDLVQQ